MYGMHNHNNRKGLRRAFPLILAAALWTEGTFGGVYAAEADLQTLSGANTETAAAFDEEMISGDGKEAKTGEKDAATEKEQPAAGENGTDGEGETETSGTEEKPEKPDTPDEGGQEEGEAPSAPEKPDTPGEGEPEEGEAPSAPEKPDTPDEEGQEEGETPSVPEEPDTADEGEQEQTVSENTISENAAEDAEEEATDAWSGEQSVGEPPLMTADADGYAVFSAYGVSPAAETSQKIQRETPSVAEIIDRYKAYPWSLQMSNTYSDKPSTKNPYKAGHLSGDSLNNALNLMNFIRYVAGIPADVTLNEEYIELTQAGALVNCVNNKLTHDPEKPSGFPDELYEKGKKGCGSSNIAMGYGNVAQSLLNGWMYDGDSSNIDRMGHRRWVLNPSMTQTGFGAVGSYSAMYAFDSKGSGITDFVAWPAQNMPIEMMNGSGTPWTISLGSDYKRAERGQVVVTLKNVTAGKTWTFSENKQDGYFNVNTDYYGMPNCIIFRPNSVSYSKNSRFQVTVTGLKDKDGNEKTLRYNVDFFTLADTPTEVESVTLDTQKLHLLRDEEEKNQATLYAAVKPSNAADKTLTWESLNPKVATVDTNGVVTAVGVGETTVTATAANGKQAACAVKVSQYKLFAGEKEIDKNANTYSLSFELKGGGSPESGTKLTVMDGENAATDVIGWSSENEDVAAVDADGVVTPVGTGEATIWANVENGLKILACEVKVENAELPVMQMRESSFTMKAEDERTLRVYLSPADTKWGKNGEKYIKWKSDSEGTAAFMVKQADGMTTLAAETISGNSVTVKACGAGKAKITAEIVDEAEKPIGGTDEVQGKGKTSCEVTVQRTAELPAETARPRLLALTNTQKTLKDIELPEGWTWKYPDTSLAQFAGQRSKKFAAEYRASGDEQPAEALLPVYFLTLENISMCVKHSDNDNVLQEVSVLKSGWVSHCYVNYSFEDMLAQFEEKDKELNNNTWYQKQKTELLEQLDKSITLTSSKPQVLTVEAVKNAAGKTALSAKTPGDAVLKVELKLGKKTFRASQKLTVAESVGVGFKVTWLDHFGKTDGEDSYRYAAKLSDFPMSAKDGINSKIRLEMAGVTKLTVKSSNSKVVALKSSTVKPTETPQFEFPLMVKAAGTAQITVTGDDAAKTSHTLTLVVTDACPGLGEETVTVNTWRTAGTEFCLYAGKDEKDNFYNITSVSLEDVDKNGTNSQKFNLKGEAASDKSRWNCSITAKADTKTGTYKMKLYVRVGTDQAYYLPFTIKVVSTKPKCSVKQKNKLNLFYKNTKSLVTVDREEKIESVSLLGCNYLVQSSNSGDDYYLKPGAGATLNSVKKGTLKIKLEGWKELEMPFTVGVEKKAVKITPVTNTVTLYPKSGITTAGIGIKSAETLPWNELRIVECSNAKAKGYYEPELKPEEQTILLKGNNLNQAESFRMTMQLLSNDWTEPVKLVCNVKVNMGQPAIALEKKTLQLNANEAYKGYDAAATVVRWKNGGDILTTQGVRVSVYCDTKDAKAKALVKNSQVVFSVTKNNGRYQVAARLNNKEVDAGSYKYIVQAAKDGKIWKTPLTLKVANTAPEKTVQIKAKGSIDVLNREGSFMTLTPSLKAVNGAFVIPEDRHVKLTGRDAHLFRASWSEDGKTIELRAKEKETLVIKYQYTVIPLLTVGNVNGETQEVAAPTVKFKVKQGSVKLSASPKTACMYSSAYNAVEIDMNAVLKGAAAPEIENVTLAGNTDAFTYAYNKDRKGTLTMKNTGRAVKGKSYSLQLRVYFTQQADNVKPVTVRYKVKVK